jgi:hypothetical protein
VVTGSARVCRSLWSAGAVRHCLQAVRRLRLSDAYRSDVSASTASDVNSKAALRQTIAVSFASAGRPRTGIFGSKRLSSVGLLAATIGNSGLMSAHYNACYDAIVSPRRRPS